MSVTADVWSCPDCRTTVHGPIETTVAAQLEHGRKHADRRTRATLVAREAQEAQEEAEERELRRREAHAHKGRTQGRTRGGSGAR